MSTAMKEIKLTIDGRDVVARQGASVLEAALEAGIYIPNLCYDPDLEPYGGCRLCIVEIEGIQSTPTACTTPAADGMVVRTATPELEKLRRVNLGLILAEHPGDCLACISNQHCQLQAAAAYIGSKDKRFEHAVVRQPIDDSNPFFGLDRSYCILCQKCVRTCNEITGINAIEVLYRGAESRVGTFGDKPFMESVCQSCGECVARCPTGALKPKNNILPARQVATTCPYCGVGCGLMLGIRGERVVSVQGNRQSPANKGQLCVKGRFGIVDFIHSPQRLKMPLIKKDGRFVESCWDEALALVAEKLKSYSPEQTGVISSSRNTNEDNYVAQKFCRAVLGSNNIDHCARLCHAPTVAGLARCFGSGAMTNSIGDIPEAACIFVIGSNTNEAHPVIGYRVKQAIRQGAKLIVADPRRTDMARLADVWLRLNPGSDVALLMGIMRVILENRWQDSSFIESRCENFDAFKESLGAFNMGFVEKTTGIPRRQIIEAARMYAQAKPAAILYTLGITEHSHGTDNVMAVANLAMLTGNLGRPGSGVNPLRGQNNVQGACDMGALPDVYPGYQQVASEAARLKFGAAWNCLLPAAKGLTTPQMLDAAVNGQFKALYLIGENSVLSEPDVNHVKEALSALDFLVVQDIFLTETAEMADVILPAACFAEKDGTFTSTERRVQRVRKAVEPPGEALADWLITCRIAREMGASGFDYQHPSQIMDEIARLAPIYGGISYARIGETGLQWPCLDAGHPGTPVLHTGQFTCGRGRFMPLEYRPPAELPDECYPFLLTTGRRLYHYHTGTMTRKSAGLNVFMPGERLQINPADAARLGIGANDRIRVSSRRGGVVCGVDITEIVPAGVVFMTFHFAETPTNSITSSAADPVTQTPEYKVCAVNIEKIS